MKHNLTSVQRLQSHPKIGCLHKNMHDGGHSLRRCDDCGKTYVWGEPRKPDGGWVDNWAEYKDSIFNIVGDLVKAPDCSTLWGVSLVIGIVAPYVKCVTQNREGGIFVQLWDQDNCNELLRCVFTIELVACEAIAANVLELIEAAK